MPNTPDSSFTGLAQALMDIKEALMRTWPAFGRIYSNNAKPFEYKNNPQATADVMQDVHHLSAGLSVVFLMAILETHLYPIRNDPRWDAFLAHLSTDDQDKLMAFKHIRHTMAHGIGGKRAEGHSQRFDEVMSRSHISDRIQNVKPHENKLVLSNGVGIECFQFLQGITDGALQAELHAVDNENRRV